MLGGVDARGAFCSLFANLLELLERGTQALGPRSRRSGLGVRLWDMCKEYLGVALFSVGVGIVRSLPLVQSGDHYMSPVVRLKKVGDSPR